MRCITRYLFSITCFCLFSGFSNSASADNVSSINNPISMKSLELTSSTSGAYQIAKSVFLPNIKDSEIGFNYNLNNRDESANSSSKCGSEYSLTICPEHGKCTLCAQDVIYKHYRLDSCEDGYYPSNNRCAKYACGRDGYESTIPSSGGYICSKLQKYGLDCYDCDDGNTEYGKPCSLSDLSSTEGVAKLEENPACKNLTSEQQCSKNHCKIVCQSGYYVSGFGCVKDSCPSGYQLEQCSSSQKQTGITLSKHQTTTCYQCADDTCPSGSYKPVEGGTPSDACPTGYAYTGEIIRSSAGSTCYVCKNDTCDDGFTKTACASGYTAVETRTTAAGSTCRKCADATCPSGSYKPVEGGNPPDACPAGYEYTGGMVRSPAGTTCYVCKNDTCPTGYTKTSCQTGQTSTTVKTDFGSTCYRCTEDTCPSGYQLEKCTLPGNYKTTPSTSGQNTCYQCPSVNYTICEVGDIVYADKTCTTADTYNNYGTGKTPIGIVIRKDSGNLRLMAANICEQKKWQTTVKDIEGVPASDYKYSMLEFDVNGASYTSDIYTQCGHDCPAVDFAYSYSTEGTKAGDWWLPSFGEAILFREDPVRATLKSGAATCAEYRVNSFWTSNEGWETSSSMEVGISPDVAAAFFYNNGGQYGFMPKTESRYVIPVTSFEAVIP